MAHEGYGVHFHSILDREPGAGSAAGSAREPGIFHDLHLDQVVEAAIAGREEYDLESFFHTPLSSVAEVEYRQAVIRDLQAHSIRSHVTSFADSMRQMRAELKQVEKSYYEQQKQRWFLQAVDTYCVAVGCLARDLMLGEVKSEGLGLLRDYLSCYVTSTPFRTLADETRRLKSDLAAIHYRLHIHGPRIEVSRYESAPDYGEEIVRTFEKFRQGASQNYEFDSPADSYMNHVEAAVLERVALLFPDTFGALGRFCEEHGGYLDQVLQRFDREVQFYLAVLELFERLGRGGLAFCLPKVSDSKDVDCHGVFDVALAIRLQADAGRLILNDFHLRTPERILVVSGANQGGKTTFARTVGQLHYLASLGCPVGASEARLFLFDQLYTHFEREEDLQTLRSKLEDDLVRIHAILERATPRSVLVMNESFSSATLRDALFLGEQVMRKVMALDLVCVFVTFLDELSTLSEKTVSMVSTVKPEDPTQRSFKVLRRPADGLAYAAVIAEKYHLTYESVKRRVAS
ncbi:MAG TPA: hypothetical protein VHB68_14430 [Steroidobacteraceae bacterium]|nr:hypothetical protein [Steroidobacteraceae bacterium]